MKYVDAAAVHELRTVYHYDWKEVAEELGISVSTLERWRLKNRYGDRHEPKLTLQQVVSGLEDWAHENKTRGIVESHTWAKEFLSETVTRRQVRDALFLLDPTGPRWRESHQKVRQVYVAPRPGYLYCVDTCHKFRRWGLICGLMVDACSRLVLTSWLADNNRSLTLFREFMNVCKTYGIPEFVRADDGSENKAMAHAQVFLRGNGTYFRGTSTANVRVECHHGRVTKKALGAYKQEFIELESIWLNPYDPLHRFILWHVYGQRMQDEMDRYARTWNAHVIRTTGKRPIRVWYDLAHRRWPLQNNNATRTFTQAIENKYAFNEEALNPFTPAEYTEFRRRVPPLTMRDKMPSWRPRATLALRVMLEIMQRRP